MEQISSRERAVARRIHISIPPIEQTQVNARGQPGLFITEEASDFLLSVLGRTRTAMEDAKPERTIVAPNDVVLHNCRTWLGDLSSGFTVQAIESQIERTAMMSSSVEDIRDQAMYSKIMFRSLVDTLTLHAIVIFPEWPVPLDEVFDEVFDEDD